MKAGLKVLLETLIQILNTIGSANDAEDHGYLKDAREMRQNACEGILTLLDENETLAELYPELRLEVESGHILGFGWANLRNKIEAQIRQLEQDTSTNPVPSAKSLAECPICSTLADKEYATQKYGWPENDSSMPDAAHKLKAIRNLQPFDSRELQLRQCPLCGTYYLYRTDFEYLVNGSEDEQSLERISLEQGQKYLLERQDPPL